MPVRVLPATAVKGCPRVDAVGLRRGIAVDDERVAGRAFGAAVDDVAAVGRRRRIGVPEIVSSPASPLMVSTPALRPGTVTLIGEVVDVEVVATIPMLPSPAVRKRMAELAPI